MTREEVMQCAEVYEKVIYDCEPGKLYTVRAVSDVYATDEERQHHYPAHRHIVTMIDPETGARVKAGPSQLQPANPTMLGLKLKARALADKEK